MGKREAFVHEKILVTDTNVWHAGREKQISHTGEYLVEIDDKVGTAVLNLVGNETHALPVFRKHAQVVRQTVRDARHILDNGMSNM